MTMEQYLNEHSAHEGEDRPERRICAYCGDEITGDAYHGDHVYLCREPLKNCAQAYILETYTTDELASAFDFEKV